MIDCEPHVAGMEERLGEKIQNGECQQAKEIQSARLQPVSNMRASEGVYAQIWNLPYLFPEDGFLGSDSGSH